MNHGLSSMNITTAWEASSSWLGHSSPWNGEKARKSFEIGSTTVCLDCLTTSILTKLDSQRQADRKQNKKS